LKSVHALLEKQKESKKPFKQNGEHGKKLDSQGTHKIGKHSNGKGSNFEQHKSSMLSLVQSEHFGEEGYIPKVTVSRTLDMDSIGVCIQGVRMDAPLESCASLSETTMSFVRSLNMENQIKRDFPKMQFTLSNGMKIEPIGFIDFTMTEPIQTVIKCWILSDTDNLFKVKLGRSETNKLQLVYYSGSFYSNSRNANIHDIGFTRSRWTIELLRPRHLYQD
jgi:hypothetical protein